MKTNNFLAQRFKANNDLLEKKLAKTIARIASLTSLHLPLDVPYNIQKFYNELGNPFFNSLTKEQIILLAPLQVKIWNLHIKFKLLLILKSQKIGISSLCILITLWHALTDCMGMELIIQAQSDEQAKSHAQDFRRILSGSPKYRDYLISKEFTQLGLLKDEVTKVHTIYMHNPKNPRLPTKIIIVGMSPGALLSHKRVGFIWSSDMSISGLTSERQNQVWAAMLSRRANSQGPVIVECPARAPAGPIYDTWEKYEQKIIDKVKLRPDYDFHCFKFKYDLGIRDGFFDEEFIESEKDKYGSLFGTFYGADFFASDTVWYEEEHFENKTDAATDLFLQFNPQDDRVSNLTDD